MFPPRTFRRRANETPKQANRVESESLDAMVLGAGFAGAAVALEMAAAGMRVALIDRDVRPLNRAHRRHVGKIELGFADALTGAPSRLETQIDAAVCFGDAMQRWLGHAPQTSLPFQYWIPADDSNTDRFADHAAQLSSIFANRMESGNDTGYLGHRPERLWAHRDSEMSPAHAVSMRVVDTEERGVDTDVLALQLADRVNDDEGIRFEGNLEIVSIEEVPGGYRVRGERFGKAWSAEAPVVVNATQHNRTELNRCLGIVASEPFERRTQVRLIIRLPENLSNIGSISLPEAPLGDVVVRKDGTAYVSWFPSDANVPMGGKLDPETARELGARVLADYARMLPGIDASTVLQVDTAPLLVPQRNSDQGMGRGFQEFGGYFTVDPGTLTTGPFHGIQLARHLIARAELSKNVLRTA
jgi:glycine/D-amino acid oxidase-like deaminating enzyme